MMRWVPFFFFSATVSGKWLSMGRWLAAKTSLIPFRVQEWICLAGFQSMPMWEQDLPALPKPFPWETSAQQCQKHEIPRATWQSRKHFHKGHILPRPVSRSRYSILLHVMSLSSKKMKKKNTARTFSEIFISVGVPDSGYQDGLVRQV